MKTPDRPTRNHGKDIGPLNTYNVHWRGKVVQVTAASEHSAQQKGAKLLGAANFAQATPVLA